MAKREKFVKDGKFFAYWYVDIVSGMKTVAHVIMSYLIQIPSVPS